ncbi:hypothetical protein DM860_003579 [Cuscuta australis]|uniref:Pentatricopeptide repeat-containing protein n=1 Tax=Cuscuta australis TaxID=267555 RepID=A0A328DI10_9ASTE|nr:hypothetical protein DM860_003579 [Cuscuta australis]
MFVGGGFGGPMRKSFKESLKVLEADIQHANTLASEFPREYDGARLQMRISYSPVSHLFMFLVQWTDCHLAGALGLLRILIYKVYVDGTTTMSIHERKASIREFYAVVYPSIIQLQSGVTDSEDKKQRAVCVERYKRRDDGDCTQSSDLDGIERDEECRICMEVISSCLLACVLKAYGLAFDVYGKITRTLNRAQFTPSFLTLAALVEIFVHTHKPDLAFSVFGIILKQGFVINVYLLNMLLKGFCENGMVDKGVELLCESDGKPMVSPDRVSYNTLIKGLCNANRLQEALELRAGMETANLPPNLLIYTILMDGFFRDDRVDEAMGLLEEMKIKGLEPDVFTYSTLVNGLCSKGMVNRGKEVFDEMLVQGVSPNVVTYTSLINGFCKKGQLKETDTVTFTSIIDGLCKDGKVNKAPQVFNLMLGKGLGLGNTTYNVLIRGLCTKGLLTDAYNILQVMIEKGEKPNVVTFNTIMMGPCDHGKVDDAMTLFNSMCTEKDYAEPDVRTVTLLVHALCQKKRTCQAAEIHDKMMIKNKHLVDVQTFTVLIGAHLNHKQPRKHPTCAYYEAAIPAYQN